MMDAWPLKLKPTGTYKFCMYTEVQEPENVLRHKEIYIPRHLKWMKFIGGDTH